jgi:hypothetical protein
MMATNVEGKSSIAPGEITMKKFGWNESQLTLRVLAMVRSISCPAIRNEIRSPIATPSSIAASSSTDTSGGPL